MACKSMKGNPHSRRRVIFSIIASVVILSASLFIVFSGTHGGNVKQKKLPGPYVSLLTYGNNGSSIFPIQNNLSADLSIWVPSSGNGTTINLFNSPVVWNQVIPAGNNFSMALNAWKSFLHGRVKGNPTMSLIVTYTAIKGSTIDIYEHYANIAFNPYSSNLMDKVFINNFTIDLVHPFTTIPVNKTQASSAHSPDHIVVPGGGGTSVTKTSWTKTITYTGWFPLHVLNATLLPANSEKVTEFWATADFSARMEFGGVTSTNSKFLSSSNGYKTPNLVFHSHAYSITAYAPGYAAVFLPNTTVTWSFGTKYFFTSYDNGQILELVGSAKVSNLKVQYSSANSIKSLAFQYSKQQTPKGTTYGNATFNNEWIRTVAAAFSNRFTTPVYGMNVPAGSTVGDSYFYLYQTTNFNGLTQTIQDEGAIALGIASLGLIVAIMGAAASAFPGGATASILDEIGLIADMAGFADSVVNLATSFVLVVYTSGSLQTMYVTNEPINGAPQYSINITFYNTSGSTDFQIDSGNTVSYIANTPYSNVTAYKRAN